MRSTPLHAILKPGGWSAMIPEHQMGRGMIRAAWSALCLQSVSDALVMAFLPSGQGSAALRSGCVPITVSIRLQCLQLWCTAGRERQWMSGVVEGNHTGLH